MNYKGFYLDDAVLDTFTGPNGSSLIPQEDAKNMLLAFVDYNENCEPGRPCAAQCVNDQRDLAFTVNEALTEWEYDEAVRVAETVVSTAIEKGTEYVFGAETFSDDIEDFQRLCEEYPTDEDMDELIHARFRARQIFDKCYARARKYHRNHPQASLGRIFASEVRNELDERPELKDHVPQGLMKKVRALSRPIDD